MFLTPCRFQEPPCPGYGGAMATATWNGTLLAESDRFETVEGNIYFPPETINREHFVESAHRTHCGWKGEASYYDLQVDGETNSNAAFYYSDPLPAAMKIKGYVAFWNGVEVHE